LSTPAIILDGLTVVLALWLIVSSWKKGLLHTLIHGVGNLFSCLVAFVASRALAESCYKLFFREKLISTIEKAVEEKAAGADLPGKLEAVVNALPKYLQAGLSAAGITVQSLSDTVSDQTAESAKALGTYVTDSVIYPVLYILLQGLLFLLLFAACMVLVHCLAKVLRGVERLPVIGTVNGLLGGVMGALEALVVLFVAAVAVRLLLDVTGGFSWLNAPIIDETYLFRHFYYFDPRSVPALPGI